MDASAGDGFDMWSQTFTGGVDRVGPHRVAHVIDQVNNEKRADGGVLDDAHFQVTRAATELFQDGVDGVSFGK